MKRLLRIGTRGSALALAQAHEAKKALEGAHPELSCELIILKTSGDDFTSWKKKKAKVKGLFVKEIEEALLEGKIELAVHSVKDLESELPKGLRLSAILPRGNPQDAVVTADGKKLKELPADAAVGASSLRRQAQILRLRRDIRLLPIRGNVDTRLRKLDAGEYQCVILAACGLIRLGQKKRIAEILEVDSMVPAPGQGALGIEIRADREDVAKLVSAVNHPDSQWEVAAERSFLSALGGGCDVPIGGLARVSSGTLSLTGAVFSPDGRKAAKKEVRGPAQSAEKLGKELASHLRATGADRMLFGRWSKKGAEA